MEINPHHLVMGELRDYLSGRTIPETHDEQYRQKIARYLVETLGHQKTWIEQDRKVLIRSGNKAAKIRVDFLVSFREKTWMLVKYAPGSLVTRRLSALALSRIIRPYQIPFVITTNGEDAEVIDGCSGKVTGQGLSAIPAGKNLEQADSPDSFHPIERSVLEKAHKIAYACEIDGSCMVDDGFKCSNFYCYPSGSSGK